MNRRLNSKVSYKYLLVVFCGLLLALIAVLQLPIDGNAGKTPKLRLQKYDAGYFSIDKPKDWQFITAGQCATMAFLLRDPGASLRQVFYFGEVGPVYMIEEQRQIDHQYANYNGFPLSYVDMPAVNPLTATTFFQKFHQIAASQTAQQFMPQVPHLSEFKVVSVAQQPCPINGGSTELVRGLFKQNGEIGEGLFLATVAPVTPYTGGPGGATAYGFLVVGITAPKSEFRALQPQLLKIVESFTISQQYASNCMQQQQQAWASVIRAGNALRETSNQIMSSWENRNKTDDVQAEKFSDYMRERERLYDPENGQVYEFENGFYDNYDTVRQQYEMDNLLLLPNDNYNLWMESPLDGNRHLR